MTQSNEIINGNGLGVMRIPDSDIKLQGIGITAADNVDAYSYHSPNADMPTIEISPAAARYLRMMKLVPLSGLEIHMPFGFPTHDDLLRSHPWMDPDADPPMEQ